MCRKVLEFSSLRRVGTLHIAAEMRTMKVCWKQQDCYRKSRNNTLHSSRVDTAEDILAHLKDERQTTSEEYDVKND